MNAAASTPFSLAGRGAFVTGAARGLGAAIAEGLARAGARVLLADVSGDVAATVQALRDCGYDCRAARLDVRDEAAFQDAFDEAATDFGGIDVMVNNAAEQHAKDEVGEFGEKQLERTVRTNLFGYVFLTQAVLPHMPEGGAIVNTTSVTAYRGSPTLLDYSATKGAIVSFTRALAGNLVDKGIRVNAVAPGPIWTPLIPATFDAEKVAEFGSDQPMKRPGQPNEVATCHLFLACDESSYLSGQVLHPNGGEITGG